MQFEIGERYKWRSLMMKHEAVSIGVSDAAT